ncbi:MAG: hypothetical protein KDA28_09310 [Phycisphaerales bacterium]|nr:hypothetical protein [Phycisphaerales bacterium]
MRSWENRPDTSVVDEPLYAHYLSRTGADHPGRDEILAHQDPDYRRVTETLSSGPVETPIQYQKLMSHHLLADDDRGWITSLCNCFLIREPREMITSYLKIVPDPTPEDLGLPQQVAMFEAERLRTGVTPAVLDSADVLRRPREMLEALCDRVGVEFDACMLSWPPGPRASDGVWAPYWYSSVEASTGFGPYRRKDEEVPGHLTSVLASCESHYDHLRAHRLVP